LVRGVNVPADNYVAHLCSSTLSFEHAALLSRPLPRSALPSGSGLLAKLGELKGTLLKLFTSQLEPLQDVDRLASFLNAATR
jgi:hypothetical protein